MMWRGHDKCDIRLPGRAAAAAACLYSVQGPPCDIDPDCEYHEDYLSEFKSMLVTKMRAFIDKDLANDPDIQKGRKKTVQVWIKI